MGLETGSFISDLVPANPTATDPVSEGDDHLRLLKTVTQGTFPGMGGVFSRVDARSTGYTVLTTDNTKHFVVDASATTTVTLSLPAAASITSGFSVMVTALTGATVLVDGAGAEQINGAATLSLGDRNTARVFYTGSSVWRAAVIPTGESGFVYHEGVAFSATVSFNNSPIHLNSGQIQFPGAQNASSGANTLDDYEEGTWTPTLTFDTPGDLSVTYGFNTGTYTKVGRAVHVQCTLATSAFTHTTAAGSCRISGLPFANGSSLEGGLAPGEVRGFFGSPGFAATVALELESGSSTILMRYNNFEDGTTGGITVTEAPTAVAKAISFYGTYFV